MSDVQRLDYSKPPPGYRVEADSLGIWGWEGGGDCFDSVVGEGDARASAWAHYKASNDPPGMWSGQARGEHPGGYGYALMESSHEHPLEADFERIDEARAAAWAWYDRRLALAERLSSGLGDRLGRCDGLVLWPVILTWSDEQAAEVERWLVDSTAELPEVLRDSRLTRAQALAIASDTAHAHVQRLRSVAPGFIPITAEFLNVCASIGLRALEEFEPGRWKVGAVFDEWRTVRLVVEECKP